MNILRYPEYKDSGVAWLSKVPSHWEIASLKRRYEVVGGSTPASEIAEFWDGEIVWVTPADLSQLHSFEIDRSQRTITEAGLSSCGTTLVPVDSIVLSTRAPIGSLGIAAVSLCTNQGCKALVPSRGQHSRFATYALSIAAPDLNIRGKGTTFPELSGDELGAFVFPFPPSAEQKEIAAFLDRETGKIDALIAEQEKLIALLKEKRQALISHAVTKGLDPNAPMKDSGMEWLGQVPAHWDVLPVWLLFELGRGRVISHEDIAAHEGPFPVYSSQTENDGEMGRIDTYDFDGAYLTWTTDGANAGTVFRRSGRFNCTNVCGTLEAKSPGIDLGYMVCALGASTSAFVRLDINPKLMNNVMARIRVPVPPQSEQQEISALIAERTSGLNKLMQEATRAIELLKERRAALISAAVTGKIDVRAQASQSGQAS